jgi:GNAT superfamily N-acetyltransferase
MRYVLPDDAIRQWQLKRIFRGPINACELLGGVAEQYIDTDLVAAALWLPVRRVPLPITIALRSGIVLAPLLIGPGATFRMLRHETRCERLIGEIAGDKCGYIWIVGVAPERFRNGLGRSIMNQALADMASRNLTLCLLKTENEDNLGFYEALGFRTVAELRNSQADLTSWVLGRSLLKV